MKLIPTHHAQARMKQRGIRRADVEIIVESGTVIRPGFHLLRECDVDREVQQCKRRIQALKRVRNCAAVVEGRVLITCYRRSRQVVAEGMSHRKA